MDVSFLFVFTHYTVPSFFYSENAGAATTKPRRLNTLTSKASEKQKTGGDKDVNEPSEFVFPEEGWKYDPCMFSPVPFWTAFEHTFKPCTRVEGGEGAVGVIRPWES